MHDAAPDAAASNPALTQGPESKPPTSDTPISAAPGPGERTPADHRSANLRPPWQKGVSGNPSGRPPGIPNLNAELLRAVMAYKATRDRSWLDALLETALQKPELAIALLHKLFATVTPEAAGVLVQNNFEGLLARLTGGQENEVGGEGEAASEFPDAEKRE